MLAAVWHGPNDLRLENRPLPKVLPGTVLIKVEACAICGSDLRIMGDGNSRINPPHILGHEIAGEIVELGQGVKNFSVGDRVSTGADIPCGKCNHCRLGRPNCCDTNLAIGYQFDGGFAEYILLDPLVVKHGPMKKFSEKLSWNNASLAEPLACCINGYERAFINKDKVGTIVIFGAGPIGLMLLLLGRNYYNVDQIVIVEPSKNRRQIASQLGADFVIDPDEMDPVLSVMDFTNQQGANLIFTACPVVKTHTQAIQMVAKRGVVNLFGGVPKTDLPISLLSNFIHYREAYITGSHGSTPKQHSMALDLIEKKVIDISKIVSNTVSLSKIHEGFEIASNGTSAKVIINP
jgi:L-iditol 2-dehydrogenase